MVAELSEASQMERDRYHKISLMYGILKKLINTKKPQNE